MASLSATFWRKSGLKTKKFGIAFLEQNTQFSELIDKVVQQYEHFETESSKDIKQFVLNNQKEINKFKTIYSENEEIEKQNKKQSVKKSESSVSEDVYILVKKELKEFKQLLDGKIGKQEEEKGINPQLQKNIMNTISKYIDDKFQALQCSLEILTLLNCQLNMSVIDFFKPTPK